MINHRNTSQRALIYEVAQSLYHPSAEEVYSAVKTKNKGIGRATVFRNLNFLSDEGKFTKVCFQGEPTRFDTNVIPHDHFVCKRCGAIVDFPPASNETKSDDVRFSESNGLLIETKSVTYYGLCEKCRKTDKI